MPKFNIYAGSDYPGQSTEQVRCEVGWARGCDVQIAVTQLQPGLEPVETGPAMVLDPNTTITISGDLVRLGSATHTNGPPSELAWQGRRMTISRPQINELIRTLREARDAAYGRDE